MRVGVKAERSPRKLMLSPEKAEGSLCWEQEMHTGLAEIISKPGD